MLPKSQTLLIRHGPHIHNGVSVNEIMFHVVIALLPACIFAIFHFGLSAFLVLLVAVLSCVLTEHCCCLFLNRETTIGDWSATITGLLYGMTLPPSLPLWMICLGGIVAIGIGKVIFGGLGSNPFNPALVGRAFLQAAFPVAMTSWPSMPTGTLQTIAGSTWAFPLSVPKLQQAAIDGLSTATPLRHFQSTGSIASSWDLFIGTVSGSVGETSAVLILVGGLYLVARNAMNWRIPVAILLTVAVISAALHPIIPERCPAPLFMLGSGGLMLGAVFMATDMVASPITQVGCVFYGIFIGVMVVMLRVWGGMPEGVMYAILMGNAVSPLIDRSIQPQPFGMRRLSRQKDQSR
jgi:electron transport complex protein RnfD